jgi:hypothetical protein
MACANSSLLVAVAVHSAMVYIPIGALSPASAKAQRDRHADRQRSNSAIKRAAGLTTQSGMSPEAVAKRQAANSRVVRVGGSRRQKARLAH